MRVVRVYHAGRIASHRARERALHAAGVQVTLVVPAEASEPGAEADLSSEPFRVVELPTQGRGMHMSIYRGLGRLMNEVQPDIVDVHEEPYSLAMSQALHHCAERNLPVVGYTAQNIDKRYPPPFAQLESYALARLGGVYPCSNQAASVVRGRGALGRVHVLGLGVEVPTTARPSKDDTRVRLLLVGRLEAYKGVWDAVDVLARLHDRGLDVVLELVGNGTALPGAQERAAARGVADRLTHTPWVTPAELAERYARADVVLVPSWTTSWWAEQFGRVVVEAQASGCLVAGYATGSIPEVAGPSALLVPEGDAAGLADLVFAVLDDQEDHAARTEQGRARAGTTTWDSVAAATVELYRTVLEDHARRDVMLPPSDVAVQKLRHGEPLSPSEQKELEDPRALRALAQRGRGLRERRQLFRTLAGQQFGPTAATPLGLRPLVGPRVKDSAAVTQVVGRSVDALLR